LQHDAHLTVAEAPQRFENLERRLGAQSFRVDPMKTGRFRSLEHASRLSTHVARSVCQPELRELE
jgi:hypothetical protein